jgi:signal transduction histidine kinase
MNHQVASEENGEGPERQPPVKFPPLGGRRQIKDLCRRTSISLDTFTRLLGVSRRAVGGWISGNEIPNKSNQKKLNELFRLFTALNGLVDLNKIGPWLEQANMNLNGATPLEVIERGESDRIWRLIETGDLLSTSLAAEDLSRFRLHDEVKKNLVLTVAQELKTPLTSIRMGLHLLLEEKIGSLNEKQTALALAAREDSEYLLRVINDLLDIAQFESEGTRRMPQPVAPKHLVDSTVKYLSPFAQSFRCQLVGTAEPGLPAVKVEPGHIHHVFFNLISNAAEHSEVGDEILVRAGKVNDRVRFSVIDHGEGIRREYQSRVLVPFFRIPGREMRGTGLGLTIVKEIVAFHRGEVGLRSTPGQGSEFYFELPFAERIEA